MKSILESIFIGYTAALRMIVLALVLVSGVSVVAMIAVTCSDVILRRFDKTITGAYDIVKILSTVALSCALPYTTAVKGHVAIEFFFNKLGRGARLFVDSIMRALSSALFGFFAFRSFIYGNQLHANNQVTLTLQIPVFWIGHLIGFCCVIVMLVIAYSLFRPNKEMIRL